LKNDSYIFNLDECSENSSKHPKEINFVHGVDQLIHQETFIDVGICHKIAVTGRDKKKSKDRKP
jgi:hypothetical protein